MTDITQTDSSNAPGVHAVAAASPAGSAVSVADVRHVAALANLQLTPDEEPAMQRDLNAVLAHVAQLAALDTAGVPAMAQVSELLQHEAARAGADLRSDAPRSSVDRSVVMREAPETDGRFFKVPKVIER